jgi:hypothetical protein
VPEVAVQVQCLPMAGGGGGVVTGLLLHDVQLVEGAGLAERITEVTVQAQGLLVAGGRGRVQVVVQQPPGGGTFGRVPGGVRYSTGIAASGGSRNPARNSGPERAE